MRTCCKPQQVVVFLSLVLLLAAVSWLAVAAAPVAQTTFSCTNVTEIPQRECEALVALYTSTNGPGWTRSAGWLITNEPCGWDGVRCQNGHVKRLGLEDNGLSGVIPSELGNLTNLQELALVQNNLSGTIPSELGDLANLQELYLGWNGLSGTIPTQLGNLANLQVLHLDRNGLSGTIPTQLGNLANLQKFSLRDNSLIGTIPSELGDLTNLQELFLSNNALSGTIPPQLGNLTNLGWLYLYGNSLSGTIPPQLGNLANLQVLYLYGNSLNGTIPPQLGNLANLQVLHLDHNSLSGTIPPEFGNLTNLQELYLGWNGLSGTIPPELGNLANLGWLYLDRNSLSGAIPPQLGNLTNLQELYLSNNALSGAIPPQLGNLTNLANVYSLRLRYNALTATNDALLAWLAQKEPDWAETQTVALTAVQASSPAADRIVVSWTPIRYTGDGGYYEISVATNPAGPFTVHGVTPDKTSTEYTLTGLAPGTPYFVRLRTYTPPHGNNQNELWSDYSEVVRAVGPLAFSCANVTEIPESECQTLVALYNSTNGTGWADNTGWLTTNEPCGWYGVTCENGHVKALSMNTNGLSGTIPPQLANFTNLQELFLDNNGLSGTIPPQLGNLANLQVLHLGWNGLSGTIPPELGKLTNLQDLFLSFNYLSGTIPPELSKLTNLQDLYLSWNQLSGTIPPELGKLTNLALLVLGGNGLSGTIPPQLGNLANLQELALFNNTLSGAIPPELANLVNLKVLYLNSNALSGTIPSQLANLTKVFYHNLCYNGLTASDDPALLAWLVRGDAEWTNTQTVAPTAVQASALEAARIVVSWTPIRYTGDGGYYEISYAKASAGPFTVHGVTPDKTSTQYTLTGLTPGTTYFVRVRTYTPPHASNQNELWSDYSMVVSATTPGGDKGLVNPGFESGVWGWRFYTNGTGALSNDSPGYTGVASGLIEIDTLGTNMQLYQSGFTLVPNTRYRLQFFAKSSTGHDLSVYVHQHSDPYTNYGVSNFRVNLTPTWKRFTINFTSKRFTAPTTDTRLRFWLTGLAKANDSYWFDDISLVKLPPTLTAAQAQGVGEIQGLVQGVASPTMIQLIDSESEGAVYQVATVTDAIGHFQLTAVPYGSYELRVTPPAGYLAPEGVQLAVSDEPNEEISFTLTPVTSTYFLPQISR